jgi:hypothetical protein
MIIIQGIPGLSSQDVINILAHRIPIGQIKTAHGGFVVDEETALWFLQAYQAARSDMGTTGTPEATTTVYDVSAEFSVSGDLVADAVTFDEDTPVPEPDPRPELTPTPEPPPAPRRGRPPKIRKGADDGSNL